MPGIISDGTNYYIAYNPDPRLNQDTVISGPRKDPIVSCQYWVKGLSAKCKYFVDGDYGQCTYMESAKIPQVPSGFNGGICDCMGRRSACDKYEPIIPEGGENKPSDYMCVAINPFISGIGKPKIDDEGNPIVVQGSSTYLLRPLKKTEVKGYNEGDGADGVVGKCDGCGMGRGASGEGLSKEDLQKLPVICPYYRPWQMGFGSIKPHPIEIKYDKEGRRVITPEAIRKAYEIVSKPFERQIPFSFKIYNLRAKYQKCKWWHGDPGVFFWDANGLGINLPEGDPFNHCRCINKEALPYIELYEPPEGVDYYFHENVWCRAGSIVCNGAKPECPCYTGEWFYCTDKNMHDGMRITAKQILELRFWIKNWASQEEYDRFFEARPTTNYDDITTADIYTFTKWEKLSLDDPSMSIMRGKKVHMCQPAPIWDKTFDPETYISVKGIIYPNYKTGTMGPDEASFPTLIRDIEEIDVNHFEVIYPYMYEGEQRPCADATSSVHIKRSNTIENDSILCVGSTIPKTKVYAFNSMFVPMLEEFAEYPSAISMNYKVAKVFYEKMEDYIEMLFKNYPKHLYNSVSDHTGYFDIGPVELKYQNVNIIIICVQFDDGTWDYTIRRVWSQWYGGLILQDKFLREIKGTTADYTPLLFSPRGSASGKIFPLQGRGLSSCKSQIQDLFSVHSRTSLKFTGKNLFYHSYSIGYVEQSITLDKFTSIGNSSKIWCEIDDINLNYIFKWEVSNAEIMCVSDKCGEYTNTIKLKVSMSQNTNIPPNAFILEPEESGRVFNNRDCVLNLTYRYYKLENSESISGGVTTWPDYSREDVFFDGSPFNLMHNENAFNVTDIGSKTVALMATFTDENGRLISTFATKLLTEVVKTESRSIEIYYAYSAPAQKYRLNPYGGLAISRGGVSSAGSGSHFNRPHCGDHDVSMYTGYGPVWFPFDSCESMGFYDVYTGANICVMPYEGTPRPDMRYCGPEIAYPSTDGTMYALFDCGHQWKYGYSKTEGSVDGVRFVGYANKSTTIDVGLYNFLGWTLPPFGNNGREFTERWLSSDCMSHMSYTSNIPKPKRQWMPIVPDVEHFFMSFNCYEGSQGIDPFGMVSQLNFFVNTEINEYRSGNRFEYDRRRFDDILDNRFGPYCSYPKPLVTARSGLLCSIFYNFKDEDVVWTWQELWRDLVRSLITEEEETADLGCSQVITHKTGRLDFVQDYYRTPYSFDLYKKEHRFIPQEGTYKIKFVPPQIENGFIVNYPSISIDGHHPRFFNIIYKDYDDTLVEFMDEDKNGSGGSTGDSTIYEKTSDTNKWCHDPNAIFDSEGTDSYSAALSAGRGYVFGWDEEENLIEKAYNRGLTPLIYKNRLKYMPYEEVPFSMEPDIDEKETLITEDNTLLKDVCTFIFNIGEAVESGIFTRLRFSLASGPINIEGVPSNIVIPNIKLEAIDPITAEDIQLGKELNVKDILYESSMIEPNKESKQIKSSMIDIELGIDLTKLVGEGKIQALKLTLDPGSHYIAFSEDCEGFIGFVGKYIEHEENIYVYERMYVPSIGDVGDFNLNGPDRYIRANESNDNSGVYYPFGWTSPDWGKFKSRDKLRSACAHEKLNNKERIPVPTVDDLYDVEAAEQMKLYNNATGIDYKDEKKFMSICPVNLEQFFDSIGGVDWPNVELNINSSKLYWKNHLLNDKLEQYPMWMPGGHIYKHSEDFGYTTCFMGSGPKFFIYSVDFVHSNHAGTSAVFDPFAAFYTVKAMYVQSKWLRYGVDIRNKDFIGFTVPGQKPSSS